MFSRLFAPLPRRFVVGLLVVATVVCIYYVFAKGSKRSAFVRWRPQIEALMRGEDAYTQFGFPYPPIMAIVLRPFAMLPVEIGMTAWFACKTLLLLLAMALWARLLARAFGQPPSERTLTIATILAAGPLIGDLLHGNINLWILFLAMAGVHALASGSRASAGWWWSLATACKVTPALLLAFLGWKRAWTGVFAATVGLAVWFVAVPTAVFGWERTQEYTIRWGGLMLRPYLESGAVEIDVRNQSLAGWFHRTFVGSDAEVAPPAVVKWAWRGVGIALLGLLWFQTWRPIGETSAERLLHEFCLVLLAMLLLSERSWKHHYVTVLPSAWLLAAEIAARRPRWQWLLGLALGAALLTNVASADVVEPIFGDRAADRVLAYGPYAWAAILLAAGHVIAVAEYNSVDRRRAATQDGRNPRAAGRVT